MEAFQQRSFEQRSFQFDSQDHARIVSQATIVSSLLS